MLNDEPIIDMGSHLILDFQNVSGLDLDDLEAVDTFLTQVISDAHATIEGKQRKKFEPIGVSIIYLLSESHLSIHTWPEEKACAIDFYHCGETAFERMGIAEKVICEKFGWNNCTSSLLINRGKRSQYLLNDYP
jgi:spermidine synthase